MALVKEKKGHLVLALEGDRLEFLEVTRDGNVVHLTFASEQEATQVAIAIEVGKNLKLATVIPPLHAA